MTVKRDPHGLSGQKRRLIEGRMCVIIIIQNYVVSWKISQILKDFEVDERA
jgi:hypothetical protein